MSEETVPPYRSAYDELVFQPSDGPLIYQRFDPILAESIASTAKQICKVLTKHFNQEKPMNECRTPKPAYKPGDRVLYKTREDRGPAGVVHTSTELVFIGFDPEQPTVALVRDVGNVNAPIRAVHSSYITVERVMDCVVYAARDRIYTTNLANLNVKDLDERLANYETKKAVDAMVTKDGLVLIKYIDQPVEEAAMIAAQKNPTLAFRSARRSMVG